VERKVIRLLAVYVSLVCIGVCLAQTDTHDNLLPPRPTLIAVHFPDLSQLEREVRDQLTSLQQSTAAVIKNSASTDAQLSEAYGALGEIYHAYSLNAPARECYVNANRLAPKDFRWVYLLAKLDQQEGRVNEAIEEYRNAGALQPDYLAVQVNLGNIYLELNRLEDARMSFAAALKMQEVPAAHYGLGQIALSQRNFAEAVNHFKKALALAPAANRIHYSLAMAYRGLKDQENARAHLAQQGTVGVRVADPLVDRFPELIMGERVHLIRGRLALEAKRYEESAAEFRKAVAANPESIPALVNLGAALTQTGNLKKAAEQFEKALRIDPNNLNAHYNLAVLLLNDDRQAAIVHLQAVSKINPNDFAARFLLARQLVKVGRLDEALKLAQLLYEATGSLDHGALVALALAELGRCSEAADWQRKMIAVAEQQRLGTATLKADLARYEKGPPCQAGSGSP
jgi:tetratricopeptide (TPR) repeat protein